MDPGQDPLLRPVRHRRVRVVLVHQRQVVEDVLLLADHPAQPLLDDDRDLVAVGRVVGDAVGDRRGEQVRVAVLVLQALAVERRAPRGAAEQEPARAVVAGRPGEVADPLEAEHRVLDLPLGDRREPPPHADQHRRRRAVAGRRGVSARRVPDVERADAGGQAAPLRRRRPGGRPEGARAAARAGLRQPPRPCRSSTRARPGASSTPRARSGSRRSTSATSTTCRRSAARSAWRSAGPSCSRGSRRSPSPTRSPGSPTAGRSRTGSRGSRPAASRSRCCSATSTA